MPVARASAAFASSTRICTRSRAAEQPHNLRIDPRNRLKFARPVFRIVRPRKPCSLVRAPTRRACGSRVRAALLQAQEIGHGYFGSPSCRPRVHRIEKSLGDGRVSINAPVAQKRPVAARLFNQSQVDLAEQNLLRIVRGLGDHAAKRIGQKAAAPELEPRPRSAIAAARRRAPRPRDSPRPHRRRWRLHAPAESSATHHIAPRRTRPSPPDASRSPWDKTAPPRPAAR